MDVDKPDIDFEQITSKSSEQFEEPAKSLTEITKSKNFMIDNLLSRETVSRSRYENAEISWQWTEATVVDDQKSMGTNESDLKNSGDGVGYEQKDTLFCADSSSSVNGFRSDVSGEQETQEVSTSSEECCSKFEGKILSYNFYEVETIVI